MRNNRTGNIFRIIAGAYLAYLGVQLVTQTIQQKPTNEIFNIVMGVLFIVVGAWFAIGALRGILKEQKQERENITLNSQPAEKSSEEDLVEAVEGSETERIEKETETTEERAEKTAEIKEETATVQEKEPDEEKQENEKAEELETDYEEK